MPGQVRLMLMAQCCCFSHLLYSNIHVVLFHVYLPSLLHLCKYSSSSDTLLHSIFVLLTFAVSKTAKTGLNTKLVSMECKIGAIWQTSSKVLCLHLLEWNLLLLDKRQQHPICICFTFVFVFAECTLARCWAGSMQSRLVEWN